MRHDFYTNNAHLMHVADTFTRAGEQHIRALFQMSKDVSHMRMGHFAVVTGTRRDNNERDIVIGKIYNVAKDWRHNITRDSEFWASHVADRTSQINNVLAHLKPSHHYYNEIMRDINDELASFK